MRTWIPNRRELTDLLITRVTAGTSKPVGKAEAPDGGGWQGEVNDSEFVPYTVITPLAAEVGSGPLSSPQEDVSFPYALTSFGIWPDQTEWMADLARQSTIPLNQQTVGGMKILYVTVVSFGGLQRTEDEPPYYVQTDQILVTTTRA